MKISKKYGGDNSPLSPKFRRPCTKGKKVQYYKSLRTRQSYYFEGAAHNHNGLPYFQPSTFLPKLSCSPQPHFFFLLKTPKKAFGLLFASVFEEKGLFMHSQAKAESS